jgi:hypothetical protein
MKTKQYISGFVLAVGCAMSIYAQVPQASAPAGFNFEGKWTCEGKFMRSGKVHRNVFTGEQALGRKWIKLTETDVEPKGYIANYLIRYNANKHQMEEVDVNNAGYAVYTGPGWDGNRLVLTSTEVKNYPTPLPTNRFVYEVMGPETFTFAWEVSKDGAEWSRSDEVKCGRTQEPVSAEDYLNPKLQPGATYSNVFSLAISYKADGIDEMVRRVSGTESYKVVSAVPDDFMFEERGRYDGHPESTGKSEIKDHGRTVCYESKCRTYTDGSGLLYNALLWGEPKGELHPGMSWTVTIAQPWELGPAGEQTVTVESVDPATHTVMLKREGAAEGWSLADKKQISASKGDQKFTADVAPGKAHWSGYTVFREGVVISDELLMERPVKLSAKETGTLDGVQRAYFLLNAMP